MSKLVKVDDEQYEILDQGEDRFQHIKLNDTAPFPGVEFQFGEVKLYEENDQLRVSFDYEVFDNPRLVNTFSKQFIDYIGNILMTNLEELLIFNKYQTGGYKDGV